MDEALITGDVRATVDRLLAQGVVTLARDEAHRDGPEDVVPASASSIPIAGPRPSTACSTGVPWTWERGAMRARCHVRPGAGRRCRRRQPARPAPRRPRRRGGRCLLPPAHHVRRVTPRHGAGGETGEPHRYRVVSRRSCGVPGRHAGVRPSCTPSTTSTSWQSAGKQRAPSCSMPAPWSGMAGSWWCWASAARARAPSLRRLVQRGLPLPERRGRRRRHRHTARCGRTRRRSIFTPGSLDLLGLDADAASLQLPWSKAKVLPDRLGEVSHGGKAALLVFLAETLVPVDHVRGCPTRSGPTGRGPRGDPSRDVRAHHGRPGPLRGPGGVLRGHPVDPRRTGAARRHHVAEIEAALAVAAR